MMNSWTGIDTPHDIFHQLNRGSLSLLLLRLNPQFPALKQDPALQARQIHFLRRFC
jgi:hypothetical protein